MHAKDIPEANSSNNPLNEPGSGKAAFVSTFLLFLGACEDEELSTWFDDFDANNSVSSSSDSVSLKWFFCIAHLSHASAAEASKIRFLSRMPTRVSSIGFVPLLLVPPQAVMGIFLLNQVYMLSWC